MSRAGEEQHVAAVLRGLTSAYGQAVHRDADSTRALLNDALGAQAGGVRREVQSLAAAVAAGVPARLRAGAPVRDCVAALSGAGVEPAAAWWAVSTWAQALGVPVPPPNVPPNVPPDPQWPPPGGPPGAHRSWRAGALAAGASAAVIAAVVGAILLWPDDEPVAQPLTPNPGASASAEAREPRSPEPETPEPETPEPETPEDDLGAAPPSPFVAPAVYSLAESYLGSVDIPTACQQQPLEEGQLEVVYCELGDDIDLRVIQFAESSDLTEMRASTSEKPGAAHDTWSRGSGGGPKVGNTEEYVDGGFATFYFDETDTLCAAFLYGADDDIEALSEYWARPPA